MGSPHCRFDKDLIRNADRISDAIVDRLRDRGFVKTLSDSTKLGSEVARRVDNEISATVADLDEDLSAVVGELHDDLDEQLELYRKRCRLSNVPTSIAAASGGAVVAGAGFFGLTSVTSAFATASSAAAVGTAGASATGAAPGKSVRCRQLGLGSSDPPQPPAPQPPLVQRQPKRWQRQQQLVPRLRRSRPPAERSPPFT